MISGKFTEDDFQMWNNTTSVVTLPPRIVGKVKPAVIRNDFISAVGAHNIEGCQILPRLQIRVLFKNGTLRRRFDMRGIDFRGIHLQPESAYESITQVFVEGAPFQFPNELFREPLSFYGRVTQTKHLAVKGYPHIQSGTRMVSMCLQKPIPAFVTFAGFRCKVWYHDQPTTCFRCGQTGHMQSACPKRNQHDGGRSYANVASRTGEQARSQMEQSPAETRTADSPQVTPSLLEGFLKESRASTSKAVGKTTVTKTAQKKAKKAKKSVGQKSTEANQPKASSEGPSKKEWPDRSVIPGPNNQMSIVISADVISESSKDITASVDSQLSSEPELVTPTREISETGHTLKVCIPLQTAMGIPLPHEDESLEEMHPKGQKRTRKRDSDSGSEDEAFSKKAFVSPSAATQEDRPSSSAEVPLDLLDTTVPVNIDPDVVASSIKANDATEGATVPAVTVSAPKEANLTPKELPEMFSPNIEEFSSSPSIGEFSSSEETGGSTGGLVLPTAEPGSPTTGGTEKEPASPVFSTPNIKGFSLTSTIEEFSSSEENENTTGGPVPPTAGQVNDSIESFRHRQVSVILLSWM